MHDRLIPLLPNVGFVYGLIVIGVTFSECYSCINFFCIRLSRSFWPYCNVVRYKRSMKMGEMQSVHDGENNFYMGMLI